MKAPKKYAAAGLNGESGVPALAVTLYVRFIPSSVIKFKIVKATESKGAIFATDVPEPDNIALACSTVQGIRRKTLKTAPAGYRCVASARMKG